MDLFHVAVQPILSDYAHSILLIIASVALSISIIVLCWKIIDFISKKNWLCNKVEVEESEKPVLVQYDDAVLMDYLRKNSDAIFHCRNALDDIPNKVLRTIQGNLNQLKGTVAEHISYLQLASAYDRLIPFHNIADFIGIKFGRGKDPGSLDFIDIKSGNARLNSEQNKLRKIIDGKHINFVVVKIQTDNPTTLCDTEHDGEQ